MTFIKILHRKRLFISLFVSIIILCILITLSMSFAFSNIYMNTLYNQTTMQNINSLGNIKTSFDNIIKETDQIYMSLQSDLDTYVFLNQSFHDIELENRVRLHATAIRQINPYILSIQLYNGVLSSDLSVGTSDVDVSSIINEKNKLLQIGTNKKSIVVCKLRTYNQSSANASPIEYSLSVIYTEYSLDNKIANMILINLSNSQLSKDLLQPNGAGSTLMTVNADGIVYADSNNSLIQQNVSNQPFFRDIIKQGGVYGSVRYESDHSIKIANYFKSNESGLYLINVSSYKDIIKAITDKRNTVLFIGLGILVLCIIGGYFLTRKLYKPILNAMSVMETSQFKKSEEYQGEISMMMDVYQEAVKQVHYLDEKNKDNMHLLKEDMLKRLLTGGGCRGDIVGKIGELNIEIDIESVFVSIISIDRYQSMKEEDKRLNEIIVNKSCRDVFDKNWVIEIVNIEDGETILLLSRKGKGGLEYHSLLSHLAFLKRSIEEATSITLTIGIGGIGDEDTDISTIYSRAHSIVRQRFILGYGRIIDNETIDTQTISAANYPQELEDKLSESIKAADKDSFAKNIDRIVMQLKKYTKNEATIIFFQISLSCIKLFNSTLGSSVVASSVIGLGEFSENLNNMETIDDARDWLVKQFEKYLDMITSVASLKNKDYYAIMRQAKEFIDEHYYRNDLCVELLSENAGYSPNYFAKMFKDINGVFLNNYIRQVRIKKAKELLRDSTIKIKDIPKNTGFINESHFYLAFKKEVGLTPASYRNLTLDSKAP